MENNLVLEETMGNQATSLSNPGLEVTARQEEALVPQLALIPLGSDCPTNHGFENLGVGTSGTRDEGLNSELLSVLFFDDDDAEEEDMDEDEGFDDMDDDFDDDFDDEDDFDEDEDYEDEDEDYDYEEDVDYDDFDE